MKIYLSFLGLFFYSYNSCMDTSKALFNAIEKDDREIVAEMVKTEPSRIYKFHKSSSFSENVSSLHVAAYHGRNACLKLLLQPKQIDLLLTKNKYSPLHYVRNLKAARLLYDYIDIKLELKAQNGATPFTCAVDNGLFDVAEFFLEKHADIDNVCRDQKNSSLHRAVIELRPKAVEFLLAHKADPHKQNDQGKTPFDIVLEETKDIEEIRQIFEKYGMIFFPGMDYKMLFQNPQQWNDSTDIMYRTELINYWARLFVGVKNRILDTGKNNPVANGIIVNEYGLIVNRISYQGLEKLFGKDVVEYIHHAFKKVCNSALTQVMNNKKGDLELNIKAFPFVVTYDLEIAQEMMLKALEYKDIQCLKVLLENKINYHQKIRVVNKDTLCNYEGNYLHQAVFCNNPAAIELLMEYGVDCLLYDRFGVTPIEYAVMMKRNDCVTLLNHLMGQKFRQELDKKNYKMCKQLLLQITDCNIDAGVSKTLLHHIIEHSNYKKRDKYIMILKDKGANFDISNSEGTTPLWRVISLKNDKDLCEILLNAGASLDILNMNGHSLLDIVVLRKKLELVTLFLRYGAIVTPKMFNCKPWAGTELLQEAYNKQEEQIREKKRQKIEIANKEASTRCFVCFESPENMKSIPCIKAHSEVIICDVCSQELYKRNQSCPICREVLIKGTY